MTQDLNLNAILLIATGFFAGVVRGFSGFGAAMIMVPVISTIHAPMIAIPVLIMVDNVATLPLLPGAFRRCRWREVLPLTAGAFVILPIGLWVLLIVEAQVLKAVMCGLILCVVGLLAMGWRYYGSPSAMQSAVVGGGSGFFSGSVGLGGPPVILFWLGGQDNAALARANIIAFFGVSGFYSPVALWAAGLLTMESVYIALTMLPPFALGILVGARVFTFATEAFFRRLALSLIALVAVFGLIN